MEGAKEEQAVALVRAAGEDRCKGGSDRSMKRDRQFLVSYHFDNGWGGNGFGCIDVIVPAGQKMDAEWVRGVKKAAEETVGDRARAVLIAWSEMEL